MNGACLCHYCLLTQNVFCGVACAAASHSLMSRLQHTPLTRLTDLALAAVIPLHMHVGTAGIISDYVPPRYIGEQSGHHPRLHMHLAAPCSCALATVMIANAAAA